MVKYQLVIDEEKEESIVITVHKKTDLIAEIEELLNREKVNLLGYKDNQIFSLEIDEIYAFYTQDSKVYALLKNDSYLVKERLYQLEELVRNSFLKINQGCLVNFNKILKFESNIGGSIKVVLKNNYFDYISRRELKNVKRRMGL